MAFKKGQSGNPAGRPEGALSEKTKEHISRTQELYNAMRNHKRFNTFLDTMSDGDFARLLVSVVEFLEPKLARTEVTVDSGPRVVQVIHSLRRPQQPAAEIQDIPFTELTHPSKAVPITDNPKPF